MNMDEGELARHLQGQDKIISDMVCSRAHPGGEGAAEQPLQSQHADERHPGCLCRRTRSGTGTSATSTSARCGHPTTWTIREQDSPNHLGL